MKNDEHDPRLPVMSVHFGEEVLAAEYHNIRALHLMARELNGRLCQDPVGAQEDKKP